jgi:hypothetical protein
MKMGPVMFARLVSVCFVLAIIAAPFAGLAALASSKPMPFGVSAQKSMCMTAGVSCGAGHILLPAMIRG